MISLKAISILLISIYFGSIIFYSGFFGSSNKIVKLGLIFIGITFFLTLCIYMSWAWLLVGLFSFFIALIYNYIFPKTLEVIEEEGLVINLKHSKGVIKCYNPFLGFLGYGGAGSGKTASLGKPLLEEFMRNKFSLFVYDAKENDYTKTAFFLKDKLDYPYPIYNIDCGNLNKSNRFNPIKYTLFERESEVFEITESLYKVLSKKNVLNEWDDKALGILKAAAYYLYSKYPKYLTIPHLFNFVTQNSPEELVNEFQNDSTCRNLASSLINSQGSKATMDSIMSTLSGVIASFAANKEMCYILTGDDFDLDLVNPDNPKAFFITNTFSLRNQISPLVAICFVMAMKRVRFGNKIPLCTFLDEATTFKIEDLEAYPSEFREYLVSMVLLTQSPFKISKLYGNEDLSSLESNLQNRFILRTKEDKAARKFSEQFAKTEKNRQSVTSRDGSSQLSTTNSKQEVKKYEPDFFMNMRTGQSVGTCVKSNVKEFNVQLTPYESGTLQELPNRKIVSNEQIQVHYQEIINQIKIKK